VTTYLRDPSKPLRVLVFVALAAVGATCGGGSKTPPPVRACTPGASTACTCTSGSPGAQVCSSDGSSLGACTCRPTSGASGSTGTGGGTSAGGTGGTLTGAAGSGSSGTAGGQGGASGSGSAGTMAAQGGASGADAGIGSGGKGGADAGTPPVDASVPDGNVSPPSDGGYTGRLVTVQIKDAIIAPGMSDGSDWDGIGNVDPSVLRGVASALLESDPAAAVAVALTNPALDNVDKPDPYGSAQPTVYGVTYAPDALATRDQALPDTFQPIWPSTWLYKNIPIDTDVRIAVDLWDKDLVEDDTIGSAEIDSTDLKAALAAQKKYEVRVDDQTSGQLLFIGISVVQQQGVQ
jgi:hypothetical protein